MNTAKKSCRMRFIHGLCCLTQYAEERSLPLENEKEDRNRRAEVLSWHACETTVLTRVIRVDYLSTSEKVGRICSQSGHCCGAFVLHLFCNSIVHLSFIYVKALSNKNSQIVCILKSIGTCDQSVLTKFRTC